MTGSRAGVIVMLLLLEACTFGVPVGGGGTAGNPADYGDPDRDIRSKTGNPPSYVVFGQRYRVLDSAVGYSEQGMASWYGPDFHGKRTSSGERYDMHAMTAAHKTLPIPTWVRVTNLSNGKSVVVKINDRGPFARGRIIDLSYAAAKKLDMIGPGTAEVRVEAVDRRGVPRRSPPAPVVKPVVRPAPPAEERLYIQIGSFASEANARKMMDELLARREQPLEMKRIETNGKTYYRVRLGPLLDYGEADSVQKRLRRKGYVQARIVSED